MVCVCVCVCVCVFGIGPSASPICEQFSRSAPNIDGPVCSFNIDGPVCSFNIALLVDGPVCISRYQAKMSGDQMPVENLP